MRSILLVILLNILVVCSFGQDSKYRLYPKDETKNDLSLVEFIEKLKTSIKYKDTTLLFKLLDKNIISSYGGGESGVNDFISHWHLRDTTKMELWQSLLDAMKYGGVFDIDKGNKIFTMPYFNSNKLLPDFGKREISPYSLMICTSPKSPVFDKPNVNSKIREYLCYDFVIINDGITDLYNKTNNDAKWIYISTFDNKLNGWVQIDNFESCAGLKLIIENKNKEWKIITFAAFD